MRGLPPVWSLFLGFKGGVLGAVPAAENLRRAKLTFRRRP